MMSAAHSHSCSIATEGGILLYIMRDRLGKLPAGPVEQRWNSTTSHSNSANGLLTWHRNLDLQSSGVVVMPREKKGPFIQCPPVLKSKSKSEPILMDIKSQHSQHPHLESTYSQMANAPLGIKEHVGHSSSFYVKVLVISNWFSYCHMGLTATTSAV